MIKQTKSNKFITLLDKQFVNWFSWRNLHCHLRISTRAWLKFCRLTRQTKQKGKTREKQRYTKETWQEKVERNSKDFAKDGGGYRFRAGQERHFGRWNRINISSSIAWHLRKSINPIIQSCPWCVLLFLGNSLWSGATQLALLINLQMYFYYLPSLLQNFFIWVQVKYHFLQRLYSFFVFFLCEITLIESVPTEMKLLSHVCQENAWRANQEREKNTMVGVMVKVALKTLQKWNQRNKQKTTAFSSDLNLFRLKTLSSFDFQNRQYLISLIA